MTRSTAGASASVSASVHVPASLKAMLAHSIDYAGVFPPAALETDAAARNYARYRDDRAAGWLLGRFVCAASKLNEVLRWLPQVTTPGKPLPIIAIGRPGADANELTRGLRLDLECVRAFRQQAGRRARVEGFEMRLPGDVAGAQRVVKEIARAAKLGMRPFCEVPVGPDFASNVGEFVALIATNPEIGAKLRCGGADPSAVPSSEQVAAMIVACRDARVPLKFTGGLHHAIRGTEPTSGAKAHGFINVFIAAVIARVGARTAADLLPILDDENAADFKFLDYAISWQTVKATTAQVTAVRRDDVIAFGSCSFDEPREELRKLGWVS